LFQYIDDDSNRCAIEASDVNDYLREIAGGEFSTKDYRTWAGTVLAVGALRQFGEPSSQAETKRNIAQAIQAVAHSLGNTKAVCRKCYIHPAVIDAYSAKKFDSSLFSRRTHKAGNHSFAPEESAILALLSGKSSRSVGQKNLFKQAAPTRRRKTMRLAKASGA